MRETFVSRVTFDKPNLKIQVEYLDGPFSQQVCDVELTGAMFEAAFRRFGVRAPRRCGLWAGRHS